MITLHDVLTDLSYGEFQHLKVGNFYPEQHDSEPDPRSYAQFTSHVNKGLTAIFSRFPLRFEEIDHLERRRFPAMRKGQFGPPRFGAGYVDGVTQAFVGDECNLIGVGTDRRSHLHGVVQAVVAWGGECVQ